MALPLVILGVRVGAQVASKLGPRAISALKKMDRGQVTKIVNKVKNAIKSKDTKRLENINQEIKKIGRQKGPKNVEAGPSMRQAQRLKKKETKLQKEKTAIAKRKEARKNRAKATADLTARTAALSLIKRPKKEDKPVDTNKKETKNNEVASSTKAKTVTVKKGDTLSEIAKRTKNLTIKDLLELNTNIKNPNQIKIGQKINIDKPKEEKRKSVYEGFNKKQMEALDADAKGELSKLGKEIISDSYIPPQKKKAGGPLRPIPAGNKGLPNLPTPVRNKMGFKKRGGRVVKRAVGGGVALRGLGAVRRV
tara:strand:- start:77 stop:1000 length:924 start_codon:yes stop_codon:yes gene_type:complete